MSKITFAFFSVVVLAVITACFTGTYAEAGAVSQRAAENKVVVVIADYLNIEDINRMEFLGSLAVQSHIALMNNRQPGRAGADKSKLIIGSGKRLELEADTKPGENEAVSGSLKYTELYRLEYLNRESEYRDYIGYLGDAVNENKGTACFLGNADTSVKNRSSMLVAMDSSGLIDLGEAEDVLIEDESFPFGRRTDYNKLAVLYKQYLPASSFVVVETGDMERLEASAASMTKEAYDSHKKRILKAIDGFVKELVSHGGFRTLVFISTYSSGQDIAKNNRLTPVVAYEKGAGGLLYSKSTRREGIIINTDLADYLLCKLGYSEKSELSEVRREKAGYFLEAMQENIARTSSFRSPVLTVYAFAVTAALCILFAGAVFPGKSGRKAISGVLYLISYMILVFPAAFLMLPVSAGKGGHAGYLIITAAASLLLSAGLMIMFPDRIRAVLSICLLLTAGLSADILAGSPMMKQSVLGYDPVIGARFYGIGNEYAGIYIGSSLMAIGCFRELKGNKLKKAAWILPSALCISMLGLSFLGANFGGALAGASGYLLAYFLTYGIEFNKRNVCTSVVILGAIAAVLIALDSLGINSPSHMGRLVGDTAVNGPGVIISTIRRKILMNLRLIRYTVWTKVLLSIIAIIAFMFWRPAKLLRKLFVRHKYLKNSWISIAAAAITGFAVNDSGIVLAATAMIYPAFTMLAMCIEERDEY